MFRFTAYFRSRSAPELSEQERAFVRALILEADLLQCGTISGTEFYARATHLFHGEAERVATEFLAERPDIAQRLPLLTRPV